MRIDQVYPEVFIFIIWTLMAGALLQSHAAFVHRKRPDSLWGVELWLSVR